jgi:putative stress-induced transcription regulator
MTVPSWVPDEEIKPAPMPLLLVQSFVNTWDGDRGSDLLLDPAAARDWMTEAGLWSAGRAPGPAELRLTRGVREGIRAMLVANSGGPPPRPAISSPCRPLRRPPSPRCRSARSASAPTPPTGPTRACSPCCW